MSPDCTAFAYAMELSERTFAAIAALIGAATFALMSDIAARSGSSSPARALSSSRVSCLYCSFLLPMRASLRVALVDRGRLRRVGVRDRVVREHVRRDGSVDRDREVRVDQRHRCAFRQLLAGKLVELLARQLAVLLGHTYAS